MRPTRRPQMVLCVQSTLGVADECLSANHARRREMRQGAVNSLLGLHALQAVALHVLEELRLRAEGPTANHARVAQLDLAVLLQFVLGKGGAGGAHLVADVALVSTSRLARGVLHPRVGLELAPRATNLPAIGARHAQRRQRLALARGVVRELLVRLQLRFVGEFAPLAQLALLL